MYKMIIQSVDGLRKIRKATGEKRMDSALYNYFFIPFYSGITGFASFLFLMLSFEFFAFFLGLSDTLKIGIFEVSVASLGFFLKFIYELLKAKEK